MMKKILLVAGLLLAGAMTTNAKTAVDRMDPPMWWTGMENQQLQIMVTGEGIRDAVPSVDCPGVKLDSVARLDSPNYQFLYLTIGSDAMSARPIPNSLMFLILVLLIFLFNF